MNVRMILTDLDGTLIHRHGEQIYSCNLEIEDANTRSNDEDGVAELSVEFT